MKNQYLTVCLLLISINFFAQGPNRTFGKFKKVKDNSELSCSDNCATIKLAYEKGTFINNVKAAIGIDDIYAIASEKGCYIEIKIPDGKHKIILPQGINQGATIFKVEKCDSDSLFIGLCSLYSNKDNYQILIGKDISDLKFNLIGDPYTNKMFEMQVNYLTFFRDFKIGETYYFKTIKLAQGLSLSCGPLVTETTASDFEEIIQGKNIKEKGEVLLYSASEKK